MCSWRNWHARASKRADPDDLNATRSPLIESGQVLVKVSLCNDPCEKVSDGGPAMPTTDGVLWVATRLTTSHNYPARTPHLLAMLTG